MTDNPTSNHPDPTFTQEQLDTANRQLHMIDSDREIARLLREGLDPQTVAERTGEKLIEALSVQHELEEGKEIRPVTPKEIGYRRATGQISTEEMMQQLRTWPYTFGRVMGYDGYDRGSWDDIISMHIGDFITDAEYAELRAITDPMPRPEDVDDV